MNLLLHPAYLPDIATYATLVQNKVIWEVCDNYQKQTYRNRSYIYAANGKLLLNIPIIHTQKNRQKYRDVKIANVSKWQELHWKSLESAYRTSPFFEFYEDELKPLFTTKAKFLMDFNFKCFDTICDCLQLDLNTTKTHKFEKEISDKLDYRKLVNAKKEQLFEFDKYTQVFTNKHGFISNLSILDLLFNEGPNATQYLQSQELNL